CDLLIVKGAAEYVRCRVDVRIHKARDRAHRRRWGREDSDLREQFARVDDRREPGAADDRNTALEKLAPRSMVAGMTVMRAAGMDRARHARPAATVGKISIPGDWP